MGIAGFRRKLFIDKYKRCVKNQRFIMHALGGASGYFSYIDSVSVMREYCKKGYKLFEADVNLTSDGIPVLAHRFAKSDYEKRFGLQNYREPNVEDSDWYIPSLKEFISFKTHGRFETYTFDSLIDVMSQYRDIYIMLDIGDIDYEKTKKLFAKIVEAANGNRKILWRIIAGGRTNDQLRAQREVYDFPLYNIYYDEDNLICKNDDIQCFIDYCVNNGATSISTSKRFFSDDVAFLIKRSGLFSYVFVSDDNSEALKLSDRGADIIGTNHLRDEKLEPGLKQLHEDKVRNFIYAVGMGDINGIEKTNSIKAFRYSYLRGIRYYEIDIRLTSDNKLACIDRWHRRTYDKLGIRSEEGMYQKPLSMDTFLSLKYEKEIPTLSFRIFLDYLKKSKANDISCILDIGKPKEAQVFINTLKQELNLSGENPVPFFVKAERWDDIDIINKMLPELTPVFHFTEPKKKPSEYDILKHLSTSLDECKKHGVQHISLRSDVYSQKYVPEMINEMGVKACPFPFKNIKHALWAIDQGAWIVGIEEV